jgi:hypothetical protein
MSINLPVTPAEVAVFADLVATHFNLTRRNPDDAELADLVAVARELAPEQTTASEHRKKS